MSAPRGRTATSHAKDLGRDVYREYVSLREGYKREGLTPKEAYTRAYMELRIEDRWRDWRQRKSMTAVLGSQVPLTQGEMKEVVPGYSPPSVTKAEEVGEEEMSLGEQVAWAKRWAARVQNGEDAPVKFPSEGALFWFQSALSNRREFEKVVLRVESPVGGEEDPYLQEGQYQFSQLEKQIQDALDECGGQLVELESGFAELLTQTQGA